MVKSRSVDTRKDAMIKTSSPGKAKKSAIKTSSQAKSSPKLAPKPSPKLTPKSSPVQKDKFGSIDKSTVIKAASGKKLHPKKNTHDSVLKIFVSHSKPNYAQPWCAQSQTSSTSTGFPVQLSDKRLVVVTNAHSVEHATLVQVKKPHGEEKYVANVLCIGHTCDLAVLEITDKDFWKQLVPLGITQGLPKLQDAVSVVGYPTGGESISVTQGVVSRIELVEYEQSSADLLAIQIDAAINSGNSGGPVFDKQSSCVGVAFQSMGGEVENCGYIIPGEILIHFLKDFEKNGEFSGFCTAGISWQSLESPVLRLALGMKKDESGVLVKDVDPSGPAHGIICVHDVLLSVADKRIANDGSIAFERGRVTFSHMMNRKFVGDSCEVQVLRSGSEFSTNTAAVRQARLSVDIKLERCQPLVPHEVPSTPSYLIVGGLVFVPLTQAFLESAFGEDFDEKKPEALPVELLKLYSSGDYRSSRNEQLVVLTQVLASKVTIGYTDIEHEILQSFNGVKVHNLKHLADLVEACDQPYYRFQLRGKDLVILDRKDAQANLQQILTQNMIPMARGGI